MDQLDVVELKVMMATVLTKLEGMEKNVEDIKDSVIPNGIDRMKDVEDDVDGLKSKSYIMLGGGAVIGFILSVFPFSDALAKWFK